MTQSETACRLVYDIKPAWSASDMAHQVFQRWMAGEIAAALRAEQQRERFRVRVILRQQIDTAKSRETKEALVAILRKVEEGKPYEGE